MRNAITVGVLAFALASVVHADYLADRAVATELMTAGKHDEALALWLQMAQASTSMVQQSDAYHQAAVCALQLHQPERATELAERIPLLPESKACRMLILETGRDWQGMIDTWGSEDFDRWPERLRGSAYLTRGHALYLLKRGPEAARDFEEAVSYLLDANSQGYCLNFLGDTHRHLLKDDDQALAAYRRSLQVGTVYKQCQAALNVSEILVAKQQLAEALKELDRVDLKELTVPFWRGKLLCAQGRVLAKAGRTAEARAKLTAALEIQELPAEVRGECEAAQREL